MFYTLNSVICFSMSDNSWILQKVNSFSALTRRKSEGLKENECLKTDAEIDFL